MKTTNNLEIEYKSLLTEKEYLLLKEKYFNDEELITQINYYFDTPNLHFLSNKQIVRIRQNFTHNYIEFCTKIPEGEFFMERNIWINEHFFKQYLRQGLTIADKKVNYICNLKTERYYKIIEHGVLFLDKSYYGNNIDYEIEYEAFGKSEEFKKRFLDLLKDNNIEFRQILSKSKRAVTDFFKNK